MSGSISQPPPGPAQAPSVNPGQPPFGSSPVSQPTPNRGAEAAGISRLSVAVRILQETLPLIGSNSEPGQAVLKALNALSKHVPPGGVSPGVQQSTMQSMMQKQQQMAPQIAALRSMSAGGGPSAAPPPPPPSPPQGA